MEIGIYFILVMVVINFLELAAPSLASSNKKCTQNYCGDKEISFPFGIGGSGCSYNSWFEVDCRVDDTNGPRPFLRRVNLEVYSFQGRDIDEVYSGYNREFDSILVKSPVISRNCSSVNRQDELNLEGSPFFFSAGYNSFFAVGCNTLATLTYDEDDHHSKTIGGCISTCDSSSAMDDETTASAIRGGLRPSVQLLCNGVKCCQITLPPHLQRFKPSFTSLESLTGSDDRNLISCNKTNITAFIAYRGSIIKEDASKESMAVSLEWAILNATQQQLDIDESTTECQENVIQIRSNGSFHNITRMICGCRTHVSGSANPYLPDGCSCSKNPGECYSYVRDPHKYKPAIIGVCSGLGALVFILLGWFLFKVLKKKMNQKLKENFFKRNGGLLLQQKLFSNNGRVEETKIFNSKELEKATDRFNVDRILGEGGQGTVYKGMLSDGRIVAVKKSNQIDEGSTDQFINEVVILSRINHRNVVKLFGCCLETEVPLLVYELVPNRTLFQHIHHPNEEFLLTWERRLQIATEVVGAVSYLHNAASLPIYHRDIKSSNILLDDKYNAKVSDFGTSRTISIDQTHMTTLVRGTFGYLDPEFFRSSKFTEKSDVYSFGVVIVELLTGRKPICIDEFQEYRSLAAIFVEAMEENKLMEILDPFIINEDWKEEMMVVADIARRCLSLNGKMRPTMKEVAVELEGVRMCRGGGQTTPLGQKQQTHGRVVEYDDMNSYLDTSSTSRETCSMNSSRGTSSTSRGTCSYKTTASTLDADPLLLNKP